MGKYKRNKISHLIISKSFFNLNLDLKKNYK